MPTRKSINGLEMTIGGRLTSLELASGTHGDQQINLWGWGPNPIH